MFSLAFFSYLGREYEKASSNQVLENQPKQGGTQVGETYQQGTVCWLQRAAGILSSNIVRSKCSFTELVFFVLELSWDRQKIDRRRSCKKTIGV